MTVIAWDGRTMAADKQSTSAGFRRVTTKVHRVPEGLIASCGASIACVAMHEWFKTSRKDPWPQIQKDGKSGCTTMFVDWAGQLWIYEDYPHPIKVENRYDACGSGRDYALAALELGHDAVTAVQVACKLDTGCGMGWDAIDLEMARGAHMTEQK